MKTSQAISLICLAWGAWSALAADARLAQPLVEGEAFGVCRRVAEVPATKATCLFLDGTTLYCGAGKGIYVFDVSDALNPKLVGSVEGVGQPRQLVAQKGYVYLAARETGLWVIDVRNPAAPKILTRFDTIELATGIDVAGDVLFVGQRQNGVEMIDVSDPARPAHIRIEKTSESQSVVYRDGWLYSGDWGRGEITTIDAHDMAAAKTVHLAKLKGHGDGVALLGKYLFAATGHHYHDATKSERENFGKGHGLEIFDVSDPARPKFLSRIGFPAFYALGNDMWTPRPSADGRTVFVADTHNGLFAVDYADVAAPKIVGRVQVPPGAAARKKGLPGECVSYVAVGNGAVYFTAYEFGLGVVAAPCAKTVAIEKGTLPKGCAYRQTYPTPSTSRFSAWQPAIRAQARGGAVYGEVIYAACGAAGLYALKADGPNGALREVKRFAPAFAGDVKVKDGLLYSAEGLEGLAVYDLADPLNPKEIARCRHLGAGPDCALWVWKPKGKYVVVSNRQNGYIFLDATDLNDMKYVCHFSRCPGWDRYAPEDVVGGHWYAYDHSNTGFGWVDLSGKKPRLVDDKVNRGNINYGCCVFRGDRLLRLGRGGVLQILTPGQPAEKEPWKGPVLKGLKPGQRPGGQPAWDGANRIAFTARMARDVWMFDISDEADPKPLWSEKLTGQPDRGFYFKGRLVIPCAYQGMLIEKEVGK